MKEVLKIIYHKTMLGKALQYIYHNSKHRLVPAKTLLSNRFEKNHGFKPNLKNPKTLNEKIVWLKLNDRTPLHTKCADKFEVREYVSNQIGEQYLVPLYYHTFDPRNITPENLPEPPFIIKANHDSGGGIFVFDKNEINWEEVQKNFKKRLKKNYYWRTKEWQYKNIKPRVIVEKLLQDKQGKIPFDYKLHCINGKVITIQVDMGRGTENHYRNWYNCAWEREPFKWTVKVANGKFTEPMDSDIERPKVLEEMISLSEKLSSPFTYVRVDWYDLDGKLFFGELTFHHDGGNRPIEPKEWDIKLGEMLDLKNV